MKIFDHFQHINLTNDQRHALEKLHAFLKSDEQVFILQGYAGSGKTTLLKGLCIHLKNQKVDFHLFTPTGRSAMILSKKTHLSALTIHKGIYNMDILKENPEGDNFKFYYNLKDNQDGSNAVYLIDEASMISDNFSDDEFFTFGSGHLLTDLINYINPGKTQRKIIFIGDNAQLPPINMNFSPAMNSDYIKNHCHMNSTESMLKEVVRQSTESGILNIATSVREGIENKIFNTFEIKGDHKDVIKINPDQFIEYYKKVAKENSVVNVIIITHSNLQALEYNRLIRFERFKDKSETIQKHDILINIRNNYSGTIELLNGMFLKVLEVGNIIYQKNVIFKIENNETAQRLLIFREVLVEIDTVDGKKENLKTIILDNFLTSKEGKLDSLDQRALYIDFKERMKEKNINTKTDKFKEALKIDPYFNALQAKYGYAITCHKSQGGEWENVMVDFKIYIGKQTLSYFRWAYTAITRSNKMLYCIDSPSFNALSNFVVKEIEKITKISSETFFVPQKVDNPKYFIEYRKNRIEYLTLEQEIILCAREFVNQLEVTFTKNENCIKVHLWFNQNGFTKTTYDIQASDDFLHVVNEILLQSIIYESIPFEPKFDFQRDLHYYILEILDNLNLKLTNIVQNLWNDTYYIKTGAESALLEFSFDKKHNYTSVQPKSTLGSEDEDLKKIINCLN